MRKIVTIGFAAGLLAAALPAQAADTNANANTNSMRAEAPAHEQARANGSAAADRPICVVEPRSESRIRRQICHTAREWRDLQGDDNNG